LIDALAIEMLSRPFLFVPMSGASEEAAAARTEAAGWRDKVESARAQCEAGDLEPEDFAPMAKAWRDKAAAADQRAAELERPSILAGLFDENREIVSAGWDALPASRRRAAIKALAPHAELRRGKRGHAAGGAGRHGGGTPVSERVVMWP
jgi:hypothetical protein